MPKPAKHYQAEGYHAINPYLILNDASRAIEYYKNAFGATEIFRCPAPNNKIGHAELQVRDTRLMLADENAEAHAHSPAKFGGCPIGLCIYVKDVDSVFKKAVSLGGKEKMPVTDQFYGDRSGCVEDPFGYTWFISTHTQELTREELEQASAEMANKK